MSTQKDRLDNRKKALAAKDAALEEQMAALENEALDALEIIRESASASDPSAIFDYVILGKGSGAIAIILRQPTRDAYQTLSEALSPKAALDEKGKVQMEKPKAALPVTSIAQACVRWVSGMDPRSAYVWTSATGPIEDALDRFPGCAEDIAGTIQLLARGETQRYAGK